MAIEITATNVKGKNLLVTTTVEPTTVKEAIDMLPAIKSGLTDGNKRNRVHTLVITDTRTGRVVTFERDENGKPNLVSDKRPVAKVNTAPKPVKARRLKMQRDMYTNARGNRIEIVITAAKGGGKVYEVRTVRAAVKGKKGKVVRPAIDTLRTVTGHELNVIMRHYEGIGYRFASRDRLAA